MKDPKEIFKNILDDNEEIVEVLRPNKFRGLIINLIFSNLFMLLLGAIFLIIGICNPNGLEGTDDAGNVSIISPIIFYGIAIFFILIIVIRSITNTIRFNKLCYCYTNKRIIFCSGFIGEDFKTLEYKSVLGMQVRVDLLDKFTNPNTGSIIFSTNALEGAFSTQAVRYGGRAAQEIGFAFLYISDGYTVYKRVKEFIDSKKQEK